MIDTIIFDFGNVFINLDIQGLIERTKQVLGFDIISETSNPNYRHIHEANDLYEKGLIDTETFLNFYENLAEGVSKEEIKNLWNSLLKEFPEYRLDFIKQLKTESDYKIILLSNTNELHIDWIKNNISFYEEFKACFDKFYLSHEIHLRKPNYDIFNHVIQQNNLNPNKTLFIDDTAQNTIAASKLNIHVWHVDPKKEDVINLFETKKELFK